ncbi:MAG: hypothetical protein LBJ78_04145 [Puniceicoccales bacterium]|jgi:hypothetical protein|nr:hypothetical protein [Puniceicoccales bacterium]
MTVVIVYVLIAIALIRTDRSNNETIIEIKNQKNCLPNIYHILLDEYTNENTLKKIEYDNSNFLKTLEKFGFLVFRSSCSNYFNTENSVASMLNMRYLMDNEEMCTHTLNVLIKKNKVFKIFLEYNYAVKVYAHSLPEDLYGNTTINPTLWSFIFTCFSGTPIKHQIENLFFKRFLECHISNIEMTLNTLIKAKDACGSTNNIFYAHILSPHAPRCWDSTGNLENDFTFKGFLNPIFALHFTEKDLHQYTNQVKEISKRISTFIQTILSQYNENDLKPIIILHGDHGFMNTCIDLDHPLVDADSVFGNLFAIYIPQEWQEDAKDLQFINLYRFIFNHLFRTNYPYLEQRQMYKGQPYVLAQ